jgi:hypothetical protein
MSPTPAATPCPWCGKPVHDPVELCPSCHRSPSRHPSFQGGGVSPDPLAASGLELDLGSLPPPAGPKSAGRPPAQSATPSAAAVAVQPPLALDDELSLGSGLERRERAPAVAETAGAALWSPDGPDGDDVGALAIELGGDAPEEPKRAAPTPEPRGEERPTPSAGRAPPAASDPLEELTQQPPAVDEAEVRALAGYGAAPRSVLYAVPYAWKVWRRRPALRKLYAAQQQAYDGLRAQCRGRFCDMLEGLREAWGAEGEVIELLAGLGRAKALVEERSGMLDHTRQQHASQVGTVDQSLGELETERARLESERRTAQVSLEECTSQHARADAQLKRSDIELRALHDAAREAAGKGAKFAPPQQAKRIAAVEALRSEQLDALRQRESALSSARDEVRAKDGALRELARRMAQTHGQRATLQREAQGQEKLRAEAVRAATEQLHDEAERAIRKLTTERHPAMEGLREEIRAIGKRLRAGAEELERHRLAVDAYDRRPVQLGIAIVASLAVLLVVALVLLVHVGGRSGAG